MASTCSGIGSTARWFVSRWDPICVRKHAREQIDEVPPHALQPTYEGRPDPNCGKCQGQGEIEMRDRPYISVGVCPCVQQVEVG
jgi:hypothetical protein